MNGMDDSMKRLTKVTDEAAGAFEAFSHALVNGFKKGWKSFVGRVKYMQRYKRHPSQPPKRRKRW